MAILATITGLIGLWTFATGRPVLGVQHWPLEGRALRMVGAYTAAECVLVLIVAGTRGDGTAFIVFAVGSLVIGATVQLARRQQAT